MNENAWIDRVVAFARNHNRYTIYFCICSDGGAACTASEVQRAAPHLTEAQAQSLVDGHEVLIACESQNEMNERLRATVCDEGPTATNPYNGPVRVYALTCDPKGCLLSENT